MEPKKEDELKTNHALPPKEQEDANTVRANKALDDAFYGNNEQKVHDIVDVAKVNRNQS